MGFISKLFNRNENSKTTMDENSSTSATDDIGDGLPQDVYDEEGSSDTSVLKLMTFWTDVALSTCYPTISKWASVWCGSWLVQEI